mmetsp:Transcript_10366/g.9998  ORF Transcript_10366/g.9998 Transcript_10366/m.9998 type:complete len:266 (+) Transcript_10366:117-914(+)
MKSSVCVAFFAAFITDHVTNTFADSLRGSQSQSSQSSNLATDKQSTKSVVFTMSDRDDRFSAVGSFLNNHKSEISRSVVKDTPTTSTGALAPTLIIVGGNKKAEKDTDTDLTVPCDSNDYDSEAYSTDYGEANSSYSYSEEYSTEAYGDDDYALTTAPAKQAPNQNPYYVIMSSLVSKLVWLQQQPFGFTTDTSDRESYYLDGGSPKPCPCESEEITEDFEVDGIVEAVKQYEHSVDSKDLDVQEKDLFRRQDKQELFSSEGRLH